MKIVSIVGARPQFIKAAAVSRVLGKRFQEVMIHTGQHYDYEMSGIFFDGLDLPSPGIHLGVGSGPHGAQTGAMLKGIEEVLVAEDPDYVLIYGDTNSTLAGALAAAKLSIPLAHVEAGLRSHNRHMPEEINRLVADHLSDLLLCPSQNAVQNLAYEGITQEVHLVGDVMLDVLNWATKRLADTPSSILEQLGISNKRYLLATVHRSENTNDRKRLAKILHAFNSLDEPIIFPVHPRTSKVLDEISIRLHPHVTVIDPVGYLDMVMLIASARLVMTDSGGLQKECYWLGTPCLTLRNATEWVETIETGWNMLVGSDPKQIIGAVHSFAPSASRPALYGDGFSAAKCIDVLARKSSSPGSFREDIPQKIKSLSFRRELEW